MIAAAILVAGSSHSADLTIKPGVGMQVFDPGRIAPEIAVEPRLDPETPFYVAWTVELGNENDEGPTDQIRQSGARPWLRAVFHTPEPIATTSTVSKRSSKHSPPR